jgi:hypothetical protein
MEEIAVLLKIPHHIDDIRRSFYDIEKEGPQKTWHGTYFRVSKGNLSEEQWKLTPTAWYYAHPSPKQLGNSSCSNYLSCFYNFHDSFIAGKEKIPSCSRTKNKKKH